MRRTAVVSLSVLACAVMALSACKRTEAPAATGDAAVAANDNLNAVLWMQRAQEYKAITEQTYRAAADHLDKALKEANWDTLVPEERGNDGRDALQQQYHDWFGERGWMLPNPTYGGFEPAQFNNDYSQSRRARHDAKRAALDYAP